MCLGESTTACCGNDSYPYQLEIILKGRSLGKKFKIINKGRERINSTFILGELNKNLDKYKPDMVIAMIGINDAFDTKPYEESSIVKTDLFIKGIRVYTMKKLLLMHIEDKLKNIYDSIKRNSISLSNFIKSNDSQDRQNEIGKDTAIANKYVELGVFYVNQGKFKVAAEVFKKAIELDPKNIYAYEQLWTCYNKLGNFKESINLAEKILKEKIEHDVLYGFIANIYREQRKIKEAKEYYKKANEFRLNNYNPGTRHNYQKLKEILNQKGIKLVCVQYPMRSIEPLKKLFDSTEGVIFVDNERIFKEAVASAKYEDYFTDNFGGDFGHCTRKGNRLLAENIAAVILKEVFNK